MANVPLTTLANVKLQLGISGTAQDARLSDLILKASAAVETFCNRIFGAQDRIDWYDLNSQTVLNLKAFPLQNVNRVAWGWCNCLQSIYSGTNTEITVQTLSDRIRYVATSYAGVSTPYEFLYATYPTTQLLATAINSGGTAVPGVTAAVMGQVVPTKWITPQAGVSFLTVPFSCTYPDNANLQYTPNFDTGQISLTSSYGNLWFGGDGGGMGYGSGGGYGFGGGIGGGGYGNGGTGAGLGLRMGSGRKVLMVDYRGGYESIPADVTDITNQIIQTSFFANVANPAMKSVKIADGSWTASDMLTNPMLSTEQKQYLTSAYRQTPVGQCL